MKIDMALQLMYSFERVRGRRFEWILKLRPDYLFFKALKLPPAVGFPSLHLSDNYDLVMLADRELALVLASIWKTHLGCELEVDSCCSWEMIKSTCMERTTKLVCQHTLVPHLLRHKLSPRPWPSFGRLERF